jgi:hypothetical protein
MVSGEKKITRFFFALFLTAIVILGLVSGCRIIPGPDYESIENGLSSSSISGRIVKSSNSASQRQNSHTERAVAGQNDQGGIANAEVWLEDLADDPNFHQTTDASGSYLFKNVPAGTHRVIAKYLDSSTGLIMKTRSNPFTISATPIFFTAPEMFCYPAQNIVTGQLRDADGNLLPVGTLLKLWGETFTINENGTFKSLPLPQQFNEARIFVNLPGGSGYASFVAPFVSQIVPVFIELQGWPFIRRQPRPFGFFVGFS